LWCPYSDHGTLFRDYTLPAVTKTLWVLFLVFLPFLAALVYLLTRGKGMAERAEFDRLKAKALA
jgi:Phospholipase_D-nuclease N-terminal